LDESPGTNSKSLALVPFIDVLTCTQLFPPSTVRYSVEIKLG